MQILIDTSALVALALAKDAKHKLAAETLVLLKADELLVPAPVFAELFYVALSRLNNYRLAVNLLMKARASFEVLALTETDMRRMEAIMRQYADAEFDYADAAIMAVAERLNIGRVFTFDRRDFSIFRPLHIETLELIP